MKHPDHIFLYVADPLASARFYAARFGVEPVDASPGFALLVFEGGMKIGLWNRDGVDPAPAGGPGCCEVGVILGSKAEVDATHAAFVRDGVSIAQAPVQMDFGYTFLALDPDGHRLRVYHLTEG